MRFDNRPAGFMSIPCTVIFGFVLSWLMSLCPPSARAFDLQRIEPAQVAARLSRLIILDARPLKNWQEGHIPGALPFSWEIYTRTDADGVKYRIFPPWELADALGAMGVSYTDEVMVYGDADSSWGGEGWVVWMLAWLGHEGPVYFLDGGIQLWQSSGQPLSLDSENKRSPTKYQIHPQPRMNLTAEELAAQRDQLNLIDTRGYLTEWLPGHLPGAIHIPWEKFYQGPSRQTLPPQALKAMLEKEGVDPRKPVVYYCTGGIRSGYAWLVHQLGNLPPAVNYEGGIEEWERKHALVR